MAVNLLAIQVPTTGLINLKAPDGSPLLDADNRPAQARVHSPASKVWEVANASKRRKTMKRVREFNGKIEAAADDAEDTVDFLVAITEEFVNVEIPDAPVGAKALVRAIYENPALGFIRDQVETAANDWGSFTSGSKTA